MTMQIEVYKMIADGDSLTITLEAICDSFSSLLLDIEYYKCGQFEVYIAASPLTIEVFQTGRIVGRDDDDRHFGIIESVQIDTDAENGDYLTVRGRFLMCLLERRIIHPAPVRATDHRQTAPRSGTVPAPSCCQQQGVSCHGK